MNFRASERLEIWTVNKSDASCWFCACFIHLYGKLLHFGLVKMLSWLSVLFMTIMWMFFDMGLMKICIEADNSFTRTRNRFKKYLRMYRVQESEWNSISDTTSLRMISDTRRQTSEDIHAFGWFYLLCKIASWHSFSLLLSMNCMCALNCQKSPEKLSKKSFDQKKI